MKLDQTTGFRKKATTKQHNQDAEIDPESTISVTWYLIRERSQKNVANGKNEKGERERKKKNNNKRKPKNNKAMCNAKMIKTQKFLIQLTAHIPR